MASWSPSRRSLLSAAGVSTAGIAAGCIGLSGETPDRHEVTVINSRSSKVTFRVTITNTEGDRLADEELEIGPDRLGDFTFEGDASRVEVRVDGDLVREFFWSPMSNDFYATNHPNGCGRRTSTTLTLGLIDRLHVQYGCETVRDEER